MLVRNRKIYKVCISYSNMPEEEKKEEVKEEPKEEVKEEVKEEDKKLSLVDEAKEAAKQLNELNMKAAETIQKLQELKSQEILGGAVDEAGLQKKPEVSEVDYAKAAMEGKILDG